MIHIVQNINQITYYCFLYYILFCVLYGYFYIGLYKIYLALLELLRWPLGLKGLQHIIFIQSSSDCVSFWIFKNRFQIKINANGKLQRIKHSINFTRFSFFTFSLPFLNAIYQ